MKPVLTPDIVVAGAGIIGLALALELHHRGASVACLDTASSRQRRLHGCCRNAGRRRPAQSCGTYASSPTSASRSTTASSIALAALSGLPVPYQTTTTFQYLDDGSILRLAEKSVDPRQLAAAALRAVRCSRIRLIEHTIRLEDIRTLRWGFDPSAARPWSSRPIALIHASGAWFSGRPAITPRKGQMLRVQIPAALELREVHRSSSIYVVPRTQGPQAGTALIGATEEDAGFDTHTSQPISINSASVRPLCSLLSATRPQLRRWRLGRDCAPPQPTGFRSSGNSRARAINGSPPDITATASCSHRPLPVALADLLEDKAPAVDLVTFRSRPARTKDFARPCRYSASRSVTIVFSALR